MLAGISQKAVDHLVDENYIYAKALHYLGIDFYNNRGKTLLQVCQENGVDAKRFISVLENTDNVKLDYDRNFKKYPCILILEYLRHAHQVFIKDQLPYISKLINDLNSDQADDQLVQDLKFIFPIFVEDFIKHIYEEEDHFFSYVEALENCSIGILSYKEVYPKINKNSIQEFALHHGDSDDEMKGIRGITHQYSTDRIEDVHLKVIFKELERFDKSLGTHASIENEILFPKALDLEKKVRNLVHTNTASN